ncbi:MAG: zinc ribbon domain-containing protein [Candidatus Lokiarchaeota archaeon]
MSNNNNKKYKFCPHCGAKIEASKIYCPECGKLTPKPKEKYSEPLKSKKAYSRKCPNCGSIINSPALKQCPICDTKLEELPEMPSQQKEKTPGLVFTDKKFVSEEKLTLKKDSWNFKEGINVFGNSILIYVTITLLLYITLNFSLSSETTTLPTNIYTILLFMVPEVFFSVYVFYYIISHNHKFEKIGLSTHKRKIFIAIGIGIVGSIGIYFIDNSGFFVLIFKDLGLEKLLNINIQSIISEQNQAISSSNPLMIVVFAILLCLSSISSEIVFRGVLHNTLKQRMGSDIVSRFLVIIIVAASYSIIYLIFSFPMGLFYIISNFLIYLLLGVLYEINGSLYNTIFANIIYNIAIVIIIVFL